MMNSIQHLYIGLSFRPINYAPIAQSTPEQRPVKVQMAVHSAPRLVSAKTFILTFKK